MEGMTKQYLISGRVQGVGYRAFVSRTALQLGVKGWVRNLSDGRVEAIAQGNTEMLSLFEAALKSGPPHGHVESLVVHEADSHPACESFTVRKDG
jgi:acylphosphatase